MFRKKHKKEQEELEELEVEEIEETDVIEITSRDISEALHKSDREEKSTNFFNFRKKEPKIEVEELPKEEPQVVEVRQPEYTWANSPEYEEKLSKMLKKKKRGRKSKDIEPEVEEEPNSTEEKKELSTYFEADKSKSKKLKRKDRKSKAEEDSDKTSKRKSRKEKLQEDIKNQKIFKYNNKKYTKVEDFITYLNEHYLDIEQISEEVLDDENFFGWINKNSGMFNQSLKQYKEIKAKIENKS